MSKIVGVHQNSARLQAARREQRRADGGEPRRNAREYPKIHSPRQLDSDDASHVEAVRDGALDALAEYDSGSSLSADIRRRAGKQLGSKTLKQSLRAVGQILAVDIIYGYEPDEVASWTRQYSGISNYAALQIIEEIETLFRKGEVGRNGGGSTHSAPTSSQEEEYVLYYSQPWRGRPTLFYAVRRPGDGGKDWEYTQDASKAGVFGFRQLQMWVKLHGKKAGWRVVEPGSVRRNGRSSIEESIKIRENFRDEPHKKQFKPGWRWPTSLQAVGSCEAVMYSSNKWQANGKAYDYKHVKEGKQQLLIVPGTLGKGDGADFRGPVFDMRGAFPDSFAVLAKAISIQAQLYTDDAGKKLGEYVDLKWPNSTLGAGRFDDGSTFLVVYDKSGVLAVVIGDKLDVLKDGIVG